MNRLKDLFDHAAGFARTVFIDKGEIHPMWIAECEDGSILPIGAPMTDKDLLVGVLRKLFREQKVVRYCSMIEAWMLTAPELPESVKRGASLASHPDRTEAIWISAEDKDTQLSGYMPILRPEHGKPTLGKLELFDEGKVEGRFTKLLPT